MNFKLILFPISLIPTESVSFLCDVSSLKRGVHSTQLCDDAEMTFVLTPLIVSAFLLVLFFPVSAVHPPLDSPSTQIAGPPSLLLHRKLAVAWT